MLIPGGVVEIEVADQDCRRPLSEGGEISEGAAMSECRGGVER